MRSALICLFFVVIVRKEGSHAEEDDDFQPTPIPLNNWASEMTVPVATLQESIKKTEPPPTVAALPAHYWEDALRHSVYLTLVRDKIDQLITNGVLVSPDSKPEDHASKEVDDHDLWEKIKSAPFDRLKEEPLLPSDAVILARGRLLEEKDGYRFAEDDTPPQKCNNNNCTQPKAYWSVKRVRQGEAYPGKYHYELTFSVTSQSTKLLKKPYENPVRTFTIRENAPTERPPLQTYRQQVHPAQHLRSQRAVWFHKNINPVQKYQKRREPSRGLERLFSSLFSDEDTHDDVTYRPKPKPYFPHSYQPPKVRTKTNRYISDREPYHQKKVFPYPVKPPPFRYPRPAIRPPAYPQLSYYDNSHEDHIPFDPDNGPVASNPIKSTKPAFLPTPNSQYQVEPHKTTLNYTDESYNEPETSTTSYKAYNYKPTTTKSNYRPENLRPPIYNAPPGVFVTMDKKPFKPMPPLKSIFPKPHQTLPLDFRPSPQIGGETLHKDTNTTADTAFRPMTLNLEELVNSKKGPKNHRKPTTNKRPFEKEDVSVNKKPNRITTVTPDIITVRENSIYENDQLDWAEILAAFTRTTPMASHKEWEIQTENDFIVTTTDAPNTITEQQEEVPTTTSTTTTTVTTTTAKARRTRPPPKFNSTEKVKKQRRFNNTTSTTTTSTTTTERVTRIYPMKNPSIDLMPLASSAATNRANSMQESKPSVVLPSSSTTTTTSTSPSSTPTTTQSSTTIKTYTTTSTPTTSTLTTRPSTTRTPTARTPTTSTPTSRTPTTIANEPTIVATHHKSDNRFRQSTLMTKGTSVNHDKWSTPALEKNRTTTTVTLSTLPSRRTASKFQGYVSTSTPNNLEKETNQEDHKDHTFSSYKENTSTSSTSTSTSSTSTSTSSTSTSTSSTSTSASSTNTSSSTNTTTALPKEDIQINTTQSTVNDIDANKGWLHDMEDINETDTEEEVDLSDVQENKDSNEFIFPFTSKPDNNLEIESQDKQPKTVIPLHSAANNKTKCKKKQHQNLTAPITKAASDVEVTTYLPGSSLKTTVSARIPDLFDDFFGGFTMDMDVVDKPKTTQSTTAADELNESASSKHEEFITMGDDVANFLSSLDQKPYKKKDYDYDEENVEEDSIFHKEDSLFQKEDSSYEKEEDSDNDTEEYYDNSENEPDENKGPLSLLELMAME